MNLTLRGFLRGYCRELTGRSTDSLAKLLHAVTHDAPAAAEAVMAFAGIQGKQAYLAKLAQGTPLADDYQAAASGIAQVGLEAFLKSEHSPVRYRKIWNAYLAKRDATAADRRVIGLMREKTIRTMEESGLTAYRVAKSLGLNLGNAYAYLGKGDTSKVSRDTARRIMDFVASGGASEVTPIAPEAHAK